MKNLNLEKVYYFFIILFILLSYFLYSFIEPPLYTLTEGPGDAFYYLVYGREAADLKFFSWNGLYPSNGFHPLWLVFVASSFSISQDLATIVKLLSVFLFIFFVISIWYFNKVVQIHNDERIKIISLFMFAVVSVKCFFWYMESALSVVIFISYIYYVVLQFKPHDKIEIIKPIIIGTLSSLLALSRLDLVFLISPLHAFLIFNVIKQKNLKSALALILPPVIIVGAYVLLIYLITGAPVPLSGLVKSSFPYIFAETEWSKLLSKQTWYGIISITVTFLFTVGSSIITKSIKKNFITTTEKNYLNIMYFLLLGCFFHVAYHISFSMTGAIGRWYFVIHFYVLIFSISLFLHNLKKILKDTSVYEILFHKFFSYTIFVITLPLIFYVTIYLRANNDYEKSEAYAAMKFVEMLEKEKFDKSAKVYDGTDGSFAFFSKMPTYHVKGMAATPDYVFLQKKNRQTAKLLDENMREDYSLKKDIDYVISTMDYVLSGEIIKKGSQKEQCIKDISKYNMLANNEDLIFSYYLIKSELYGEYLRC